VRRVGGVWVASKHREQLSPRPRPSSASTRAPPAALRSLKKKSDHWELKDDTGPSDSRSKQSTKGKQEGKGSTHRGVDVEGNSKDELLERAEKAGVKGYSSMNKDELGDAIARKEG
jgi:hypothetical protein